MKKGIILILFTGVFAMHAVSQTNDSIEYNGTYLFLNGSNVAWVNFASDIGTGTTDFAEFGKVFREAHDNGANSMRLWLHTTGENSPLFNGDSVIGPGVETIGDLKQILDSAYKNDIGLLLCLWSFDMLGISRDVKDRNKRLLTTDTLISLYIQNSLIPMVDSLKDHPGILAWEIFNEPEGMCEGIPSGGWSNVLHVNISDVQKFVNRCTGAIHRTDPNAKVTNGAWAFISSTDIGGNTNYYTDTRLIDKGGDVDGTLDFYTVHYYDWADSVLSPFLHPASYWQLDKPLVIAEFFPNCTNCGEGHSYENLFELGYAGAMGWQWNDNKNEISEEMQYMLDNYTEAVDINNMLGNAPSLKVISPVNEQTLPTGSNLVFQNEATDTDGEIEKLEIRNGDAVLVTLTAAPYNYTWEGIPEGVYIFSVSATDDDGYVKKSDNIRIIIGEPPIYSLEAEDAELNGSAAITNQAEASGGRCVQFGQTGYILWTVPNVPATASYPVIFTYRLSLGSPKTQYIIVNNDTTSQITYTFSGETTPWLQDTMDLALTEGQSTIKMEAFWGWMQVDYIEFPFAMPVMVKTITVTAEGGATKIITDGGTLQLYANVEPDNAVDTSVTWSVSHPLRASISETGLLTALTNGFVDVTVTANDGSKKSGKLRITISNQITGVSVEDLYENRLYPNPATVYFLLSDRQRFDRIEITSLSGAIVKCIDLDTAGERIDISGIQKGLYIVRLITLDDRSIMQKLIIN